MTIEEKISYTGGFILSAVTTLSFANVVTAAVVGVVGGFFGLLGKEIYVIVRKKITSAKFRVKMIGLYDKLRKWW